MTIKRKAGIVVSVPLVILVTYFAVVSFVVNPSIAKAQSAYDNSIRAENIAHDIESDFGTVMVKLAIPLVAASSTSTGSLQVAHVLATINVSRSNIRADVKSIQQAVSGNRRALALAGIISRQSSSVLSDLAALVAGVRRVSPTASVSGGAAGNLIPASTRTELAALFTEIAGTETVAKSLVETERSIANSASRVLADRHDNGNALSLFALLVATAGGVAVMLLVLFGVTRRLKKIQLSAESLYRGEELNDLPSGSDEIGQIALGMAAASRELRRREGELIDQRDEVSDRERLISSIFEAVPDVVIVRDIDGNVMRVSPEFTQALGVNEEQALSLLDNFMHVLPEDRQASLDLQAAAVASPNVVPPSIRVRARRPAGELRTFEVRCRSLTSHGGEVIGTVTATRDITDQAMAEEALRQAKMSADRANQAKSEFLSRMSHELRTPLNSILGFSQLIEMDDISDPIRDYVNQIEKGGKHLLSLINEVLDLARVEAGKLSLSMEPVLIVPLIEEVLDVMSPMAFTKNVSLAFKHDGVRGSADKEVGLLRRPRSQYAEPVHQMDTVMADSRRITQVLMNLLDNAIKYNVRGGSVIVCLERRQCNQKATMRKATMRISVSDTGRGIPGDAIDAIFTPFTRIGEDSAQIPGTGIGLALTKRLVEAMGGRLSVASEPGRGSTFSVDIAVAGEAVGDMAGAGIVAGAGEAAGGGVDAVAVAGAGADVQFEPVAVAGAGSGEAAGAGTEAGTVEAAAAGADAGRPELESRRHISGQERDADQAAIPAEQVRLFTVLYIEDNVANERLMEEILSKRRFVRMIPAALGRLGIDLARQHHPDLILLDLHLEDISGEDVLREVTADPELAGIPVVIVSADATPGSVTRLVNDGAYRYMTKPVDVQAVLDMIDELRDR